VDLKQAVRCTSVFLDRPMDVAVLVLSLFVYYTKLNSVALVRERTIPTERPPTVGEVSANFCG